MNTMRARLGKGREKGKVRTVVLIAGTQGIMPGSVLIRPKEKVKVKVRLGLEKGDQREAQDRAIRTTGGREKGDSRVGRVSTRELGITIPRVMGIKESVLIAGKSDIRDMNVENPERFMNLRMLSKGTLWNWGVFGIWEWLRLVIHLLRSWEGWKKKKMNHCLW